MSHFGWVGFCENGSGWPVFVHLLVSIHLPVRAVRVMLPIVRPRKEIGSICFCPPSHVKLVSCYLPTMPLMRGWDTYNIKMLYKIHIIVVSAAWGSSVEFCNALFSLAR